MYIHAFEHMLIYLKSFVHIHIYWAAFVASFELIYIVHSFVYFSLWSPHLCWRNLGLLVLYWLKDASNFNSFPTTCLINVYFNVITTLCLVFSNWLAKIIEETLLFLKNQLEECLYTKIFTIKFRVFFSKNACCSH